MTETFTLWTSVTITDTSRTSCFTNAAKPFVRAARSSCVVNPAAMTSLTSGSEILPSGRTGTMRE